MLQGLISGVLTAIGYGRGVLAIWIVGSLTTRTLPGPGRTAWWSLAGVAAVAVAVFLYLGSGWQRDIHVVMGIDPPARPGFVTVLLVAVVVAVALVGLFRLLRKGARALARLLGRWIPARAAAVIAGFVVVVLAPGVLNGVVIDGFFAVTDKSFKAANGEDKPDSEQPGSALKSGGPGSLVTWGVAGESLGSFGAEPAFSGVDDIRNRHVVDRVHRPRPGRVTVGAACSAPPSGTTRATF